MAGNVVIFKWNPAVSSYNMYRFLLDITNGETQSNWSVREYEKVHAQDMFFMLKVGCGATGIVAAGKLMSAAYADEDWRGDGRKVYYCDYRASVMVSPEAFPILTGGELEDAIGDFDWRAGHSGVVLTPAQGNILGKMWDNYLRENAPLFQARFEQIKKRGMVNDQLYLDEKTRNDLRINEIGDD